MSHLENAKAAIEGHIKSAVVKMSHKILEDRKSKADKQKKTASVFSFLDDLTEGLLAEKQVADEKQKFNDLMDDTKVLLAKTGKAAITEKHASAGIEESLALIKKDKKDNSSAPSGKSKDAKAAGADSDKSGSSSLAGLIENDEKELESSNKDSSKSGVKSDENDQPSGSGGESKDAPSDDNTEPMDPLLALVMAGIDNQTQTNLIITALGKAGEQISKVTTDAATAGNAWEKNFYNHGITSTGDSNPGQYDTSTKAGTKYYEIYYNGQMYYSTVAPSGSDFTKTYNDAIANGPRTPPWNGVGSKSDWDKKLASNEASCKSNPIHKRADGSLSGMCQAIQGREYNSNGIPGATGADHSAEFNQLVSIWQYVQQQVSQINNQFQTVAGLPSTMMQTLTQAINTANSGQSSTVQAMGMTTNLVNGWAGV